MSIFKSTDILIPDVDSMEDWAVIACDQFTSQPDYWDRVEQRIAGKASSGHLIIPEAYLESDISGRISSIRQTMNSYLDRNIFREYKDSYIYVERTMSSGQIRKGLMGVIDLEEYDYRAGAKKGIRASEKTIYSRIPVRVRIREKAPLEVSHVMILANDDEMSLIDPITERKMLLPKVYDFDLMEGGGHISGWLVKGEEADAFDQRLSAYLARETKRYEDLEGDPVLFAVGDGNHSVAAAKDVYEAYKRAHRGSDCRNHPLRYMLVELENIYDEVQEIEPLFRIVKNTDPQKLLRELEKYCTPDGYPVVWYSGGKEGVVRLDRARGPLAIGVLQDFLDSYLSEEQGDLDYIHEKDVVQELAEQPGSVGFIMDPIEKAMLFPSLKTGGPMTRKAFSMGHAREKKYYLEARKIRE